MPEQPLLDHVSIAAEKLGLSEYQVRKLVDKGLLPGQKIGGRLYIPAKSIREYVDRIAG